MPRDLPVGNGHLLVTFDLDYRIRDIYYPHVGMENHTGGHPFRFGIFADGHLGWVNAAEWKLDRRYEEDTLVTRVSGHNAALRVGFESRDLVDFHLNAFVRRLTLTNHAPSERELGVFFHHDFHILGTDVGDTAYFDPSTQALIHYKADRWFLVGGGTADRHGVHEFATGVKGVGGAEGTWRDAEDGELGRNAIAQGAVDSTAGFKLTLGPGESADVDYWILAANNYHDLERNQEGLRARGAAGVLARTHRFWNLWVDKEQFCLDGIPAGWVQLLRRGLLTLATQIDHDGGILAANDSDIMLQSRDHYSYVWPRDGALVADALIRTGCAEPSRRFFEFCARVLEPGGYLLHKYNPNGTLASSWHPWLRNGREALPIQEDETALVLWALWRHYSRFREVEFVKPLYRSFVRRIGDFLLHFRDPVTSLPRPSYDLWEERWGVHTFTVCAVAAGLKAAGRFAEAFGETEDARDYYDAAESVRMALTQYLYVPELRRFARMGTRNGDGYTLDMTVDSSLFALFALETLPVDDERVASTMEAVREHLWVKTPVGGLARYEDDYYHQVSRDIAEVPGNPWFICTLWMGQYEIARARSLEDLERARPYLDWVAAHALPSGVLAEQVHPHDDRPLSVSPLTWSHATAVTTVMQFLEKRLELLHGERAHGFLHLPERHRNAA